MPAQDAPHLVVQLPGSQRGALRTLIGVDCADDALLQG